MPLVPKTVVIGWREFIDLPEWGVANLPSKVDTGARTSALDVENIDEIAPDRVSFDVVLCRRTSRTIRVEAAVVRRGQVRSSTGAAAERLFVATVLRLGGIERIVEFNLVDRRRMTYRAILGRTALDPRFRVDASRRNVLRRRRRPQGGGGRLS